MLITRGKNRGKISADSVPWFPRKMSDLDTFSEKVLEMGEELSMYTIIIKYNSGPYTMLEIY